VRQLFGKLGWQDARTRLTASLAYADNELWGNSVQDQQLLQSNWSSVYTTPDITNNRSTLLTLTGRHELDAANTLSGNLYWRNIRTGTINGDVNGDSLDQALYQPNAAERAALAAAGYTGFPTSGENASNTPFPFWRCLANVLLQDEPAEKCNRPDQSRQHGPIAVGWVRAPRASHAGGGLSQPAERGPGVRRQPRQLPAVHATRLPQPGPQRYRFAGVRGRRDRRHDRR
jgi:hypothetical protein